MFKSLDSYSLKARLFPALLAVVPSLAALAILISWNRFGLTSLIATTAIPVLVFAAADVARRLGKGLEEKMEIEIGGRPSVVLLRRSDQTIDPATKSQYCNFISDKIGQPVPTIDEENSDPAAADRFYVRCGAWLRENTRNTKKFPVLFAENITYGYRRNLLGLKWPALILNASLISLCIFVLYKKSVIDTEDDVTMRFLIVLAFASIHSIFMIFAVSKESVIEASRIYARQLLLACETFIGKNRSKAQKIR